MKAVHNRRTFLKHTGGLMTGLALSGRASAVDEKRQEVPWLAEVQRTPTKPKLRDTGYFDPLMVAEDGSPITTLAQWEKHRVTIRNRWLNFLGPMPKRPPVKLTVLKEDHPEGCRRQLVRYESEVGYSVEGYLLFPEPMGNAPRSAVVVMHSTSSDTVVEVAGVKGRESRALGLKLAKQGFVVFCPPCFLWDDRSMGYKAAAEHFMKGHPGTRGMRKMLNDAQCALDILASLPEVDSSRIGAAGHSLGAKEALYLTAFDERVKAAVASEGGIGLGFTNWDAPWYLGTDIHKPEFTLNHHQLLALMAPRAFLILGGEDGPKTMSVADGDRSWPYIEAALPAYKLYGKQARLGLFNHHKGHTIPPEALSRMTEWLKTYLA